MDKEWVLALRVVILEMSKYEWLTRLRCPIRQETYFINKDVSSTLMEYKDNIKKQVAWEHICSKMQEDDG